MKKKLWVGLLSLVMAFSCVFGLTNLYSSTKNVQAYSNLDVDFSSLVYKSATIGGTLVASFDGIAINSKAKDTENGVDISLPVNTSGNIAIEIKNFFAINTNINVVLKKGDTSYVLNGESITYLVQKEKGEVVSNTGVEIPLNSETTGANVMKPFNGYVIIPNTNSIDTVVISTGLSAGKMLMIGKVYSLNNIGTTFVPNEKAVLYTPNATNFTATNSSSAVVKYVLKDTITPMANFVEGDKFEQSRLTLPNLEQDGTFDITKYKYLVADIDYSNREATSTLGFVFFRDGSNKYNHDRACSAKALLVAEDGTITEVTNSDFRYTIPAGFKGKVYMSMASDAFNLGANWKGAIGEQKFFSQMLFYGHIDGNKGNAGITSSMKVYFTNTEYIQPGETKYALTTSVNNNAFGSISLDTTDGIVITPVANTDYALEGLYVDGGKVELTEGKYTIASLTKNTAVEARFVGTKTLTFNNDIQNVTITANKETITNGSDVTFSFALARGYCITSIKANGEDIVLDSNNNYTVNNIQSSITFAVETAKVENTYVENSSYTMVNSYAGGTIWMPFDGIAVVSKTVTDVATEKVVLSMPVSTSKNIAIRVHNAIYTAGTQIKIDLKNGETTYSMDDTSTYYLVKSGVVSSATGATVALNGSGTWANGFYGLDGYVIIPNSNTITSVEITIDMSAAKRLFFGNVYEVETIGEAYTPADSALFVPTSDNFTATCDNTKSYVKYLTKSTYVVVGPHTGTDGWEQSRITLPVLNKDGNFDLNNWTYLVFDVDFSTRTARTRIGYEFFRVGGSCYGNDRTNAKTVVAVGDDGSYYTETIGLGGGWYIPAGFKGKLYFTCNTADMLFGTNYKTIDGVQHKQMMLYALTQDNKGNIGVESKLEMYFTTETLPTYEYKTVNVSVDDSKKGSAVLSTYKQVLTGTTATVTVTPKTGYLIDTVLVNNEAQTLVEGVLTLSNIQADLDVVVTFKNDPTMPKFNYTITKTDYVDVVCDVNEIPFGTDATFTFDPEFGYIVSKVTVNGSEVTLDGNKYVVKLVEEDLTIVVETAIIPSLTEEKYSTKIAESEGAGIKTINVLNNFYANFDSVFVSSKIYDKEAIKAICPQPYVGAQFSFTADLSAQDMVIIQYRQYHTQSASASGNGIKLAVKDVNGKETGVASGTKVYLITGNLASGSTLISNAATYVRGGMIFTPMDFSGYLAIPKASFADNGPSGKKDDFDWTQVTSVIIYDDYRWWSDSGSRYAVGNIYSATFNGTDSTVTAFEKIWDIATGTYAGYLNALDGSSKPFTPETPVTLDQFLFITKINAGKLYFFNYSPAFDGFYKNENNVGIKVQLSDSMRTAGYYDFRDVNIVRFKVDNTGNPAIDFNLTISVNEIEWTLLSYAKVVLYDTDAQTAKYGTSEIPAGFKGYIDVYYQAGSFACVDAEATFPEWIDSTLKITLPLTKTAGYADGMNLPFDIEVLLDSYTLEYTSIVEVDYSITYELDGGTNATTNPTTYRYTTEVTLANPTREGFEFQGWYITSDFIGAPITSFVNKSGDITLYAKWGANFTITYDIGENGDLTPRTTSVALGDSVTLLIFPDDGYEIASVTVNGVAVALDENDSFTISNIDENKVVKVTFVAEQKEEPVKPVEEKKIGCGSSILGISSLAVLGLAAMLVLRKKKED